MVPSGVTEISSLSAYMAGCLFELDGNFFDLKSLSNQVYYG